MQDKKILEMLEKLSKQVETLEKSVFETKIESDLNILVTNYLRKLGIPASLDGYHYLRTAIIDVINDFSKINSITKTLYPSLAKQYKKTPSQIERSIRNAIIVSMQRGNHQFIAKLFSYTINSNTGKPSNSEFIAMIADDISLKMS